MKRPASGHHAGTVTGPCVPKQDFSTTALGNPGLDRPDWAEPMGNLWPSMALLSAKAMVPCMGQRTEWGQSA